MKPITFAAVQYLTLNMRQSDRLEIYNLRNHESPDLLALEVVHASAIGRASIAEHNGKPCGIVGVAPLWRGVWSAFSFGTDDWPHAVLNMSRYAKDVLKPYLLERGCHRLQCESRVDHHSAHRWLTLLGAEPDGLLRSYGRDGSDYILFSWVR